MVGILLLAAILGAALFLLLAGYGPPLFGLRRAAAADRRPPIPLASLRALTTQLLRVLGLRVVESDSDAGYLVATKSEPFGEVRYVVALEPAPPRGVAGQASIVALAEAVRSERASVGMLITSGEIETTGLAGLDVKLELFDGPRFRQLIADHLPAALDELDRHHGFSPSDLPAHASSVAT